MSADRQSPPRKAVGLKLPEQLHEAAKFRARQEGRSFNSWVEVQIRRALTQLPSSESQ